jgi:hypothetical protein
MTQSAFSAISVMFMCGLLTGLAGSAAPLTLGQDSANVRAILERCRSIQDDHARLRCYEDAAPPPPAPALPPQVHGSWRLVRTPNPQGGRDAVSIMQTADVSRSDLNFAGLMIRCSDNTIEVLVVVVEPGRPRTHPIIVLSDGTTTTRFTASIVPPGTLVLLPPEAATLATGPWQSASDLSIELNNDGGQVRGVVPVQGMRGAIHELQSNCAAQ